MESTVRTLTSLDLDPIMRLKESASWNQTANDWHRLFRLAPEGCFGIDVDGVLAATATAICYGLDLAWIGMVLTLPDYRRRGLARILMRHSIDYLYGQGVRCIKLDATPMGRPLYESLGFQVESGIERWLRTAQPSFGIAAPQVAACEVDPVLDRQAFGADRSALLNELAPIESASTPPCGYAMGRPGANATYFGPCVTTSAGAAETMLRWFLSQHADEPLYWDLLDGSPEAKALAARYGFAPQRGLFRMVHGQGRVDRDDTKVYAIAGFEFG